MTDVSYYGLIVTYYKFTFIISFNIHDIISPCLPTQYSMNTNTLIHVLLLLGKSRYDVSKLGEQSEFQRWLYRLSLTKRKSLPHTIEQSKHTTHPSGISLTSVNRISYRELPNQPVLVELKREDLGRKLYRPIGRFPASTSCFVTEEIGL